MAITSFNNSVCLQTVLDMYGIDPLKFNMLEPICIDYEEKGCEQYWTQHFEHGNLISREELASELYRAELEISAYLGQFIFPTYVCDEEIDIDGCYRDNRKMGVRLDEYTFDTNWGCVQDFGTFENVVLGTGAVAYQDEDNDGYFESATVTFDYSAIAEDFDPDDLVLLFQGFDQYNNVICPILAIEDDTVTQVITFTLNSWNLVRPELYLYRKFVAYRALDACDLDNYVTEVDVCIKRKTCGPDGWVYFDAVDGCRHDCEEIKYPFCVRNVDKRLGLFKIVIGSLDEDGCFVPGISCPPCTKPKRISVNYLSACKQCLNTKKNISFCNLIERAILLLSLARLPRYLCDCGCNTQFLEELKQDVSIRYANSDIRFDFPPILTDDINNFGTKLGELEAYKIVKSLRDKTC